MNDQDVVAAQIGRPPRSAVDVATRCHLDLPVVIAVPPFLDDGTPFPTRFWLCCPLAVRRIGRVESTGGVRVAEALVESDPDMADRHAASMARYEADRDGLIPDGYEGPRPGGGVGGARAGVKCLHAHYADYHAGGDNPVGEWVASNVEPLDCAERCVAPAGAAVVRNPDWHEPKR